MMKTDDQWSEHNNVLLLLCAITIEDNLSLSCDKPDQNSASGSFLNQHR